jgi:hypothetical protein
MDKDSQMKLERTARLGILIDETQIDEQFDFSGGYTRAQGPNSGETIQIVAS